MRARPAARRRRLLPALAAVGVVAGACTSQVRVQHEGAALGHLAGRARIDLSDVADDAGLDFRHGAFRWDVSGDSPAMMGGGLCWLDADGDGWLDLFVVNTFAQAEASTWELDGGLPRTTLFRNVGGRFEDVGSASGAALEIRGQGCVAADLNLDGATDLYVTSDRTSALLWNRGDGTFVEGAATAGARAFGWYAGAAVGDVNGDRWPDLFLSGYADLSNPVLEATLGFPNTYLGVRDLLYLNEGPSDDGRVTFREVGVDAGLEVTAYEYGLGAVLADVDDDGDLDLYLANDTKPNRLYENVAWPGGAVADPLGLGFRFEEVAGAAGVADPNAGMGVAEGDYDGDGRTDLFVTNARGQPHAIFRQDRTAVAAPFFAGAGGEVGVDLRAATGWGVSWGDLDLDTDLDLLLVNGDVPVTDLAADAEPIQAFENRGADGSPGRFEELSGGWIAEVGALLARGSAAADFDNDGDLDVAINSVGGPLALLENTGAAGNWLEVGLGAFRPGTVVTVQLPDGRELVRRSVAGGSYLSSEDPRLHFGLGEAEVVPELRVRWPGGGTTVLEDVGANRIIVVEADG